MATRRIAAVMTVSEPTPFTATVDGDNNFSIYRGHRTTVPCTYEAGGPPVTMAEIVNADIEIFQDTQRSNRLGADDENAYIFEITNVDTTARTFDLTFDLTAITPVGDADVTFYIYLVVQQG